MKFTKYNNKIKVAVIATLIFTTLLVLVIAFNGILFAKAEETKINPLYEQKIYTELDTERDFDNNSIIVVMDKFTSGINKSQTAKFSNIGSIQSIKDLTTLTGNINEKNYLNTNEFRQIFKIELKEKSKSNVIKTIEEIEKIDGVLWAGINGYVEPDDMPANSPNAAKGPKFYSQWGLGNIHAPQAWNYSTGGSYVKVGIIDSGIAEHNDLIGNIGTGWNFVTNSEDTNDIYGHGTKIAGIIGATGSNENGIVGVNWKVNLIPLKVTSETIQENGQKKELIVEFKSDAIINAIMWSIDNNISILNMSFSYKQDYPAFKSALSNFQGLTVCSAGNKDADIDITPHYPANYSRNEEFSDRIISVGGIDIGNDKYKTSNYGSISVSIFAPGNDILTTCPQNEFNDASGYSFVTGTSYAAPFVTGVAALMYTQYQHKSYRLSNSYIAAKIKSTILRYSTKDDKYTGKCYSGARLNALDALKYIPHRNSVIKDFGYGLNNGWYKWRGNVNLNIENVNAVSLKDDLLVIDDYTELKFMLATTTAFNAVHSIKSTITFELVNSEGKVFPIGGKEKHECKIEIGLLSNFKTMDSNDCFTIDTSKTYNDENETFVYPNDTYTLKLTCVSTRNDYTESYTGEFKFALDREHHSCIADDSMITLADGNNVAVQDLKGDEELLVWNMMTGKFDSAPILFIDKEARQEFEVTNLRFSDGTSVKVIDEHGFWDFDLNKYVFLRNDADKYIGHWFNKQTVDKYGNMSYTKVQLIDVDIKTETTSAWSPVTYGHLCYYVNGMLTMPGATGGLINIFDVNPQTMTINKDSYLNDIEKYGLFTYEEFTQLCPVPEYIFDAFSGQYLKVAIGKGLTTVEEIQELISRYSKFWE